MIEAKNNVLNSPVRKIEAKVELYNGSTLAETYAYTDAIKNIKITREGENGKFFGFGVCQSIVLKLLDKTRTIDITTANNLKAYFKAGGEYVTPFPKFFVTKSSRDENTNELTITAYDVIYEATAHTVSELDLSSYTIREFATACATLLGLSGITGDNTSFDTEYVEGANFEGTETIRAALNAVAEATQTIYYIDNENRLAFVRLDKTSSAAVLNITKDDYFTFKSGENTRLAGIYSVTELGNNVHVESQNSGVNQYVRDNPFWELRDDIAALLEAAKTAIMDITINQFSCIWRGNFLLEIGDKITLVNKENQTVTSYILNDTFEYTGGLRCTTQWQYEENKSETESNPATLGDVLKQTYAKVDKANHQIALVTSEVNANSESIVSINLNLNSLSQSVSSVEQTIDKSFTDVNNELTELRKKTDLAMTAEDVKIQIDSELENGVNKVTTSTGFTFNETGLTVNKTDSEMKTQITENGMTVYRDTEAVLTANNQGVNARNLHAETYLIIGNNSRFEDWTKDGEARTACFWLAN